MDVTHLVYLYIDSIHQWNRLILIWASNLFNPREINFILRYYYYLYFFLNIVLNYGIYILFHVATKQSGGRQAGGERREASEGSASSGLCRIYMPRDQSSSPLELPTANRKLKCLALISPVLFCFGSVRFGFPKLNHPTVDRAHARTHARTSMGVGTKEGRLSEWRCMIECGSQEHTWKGSIAPISFSEAGRERLLSGIRVAREAA